MNERRANYITTLDNDEYLMIKDIGPWDKHLTITNDVEQVVKDLLEELGMRRLFYMDTEGEFDEIIIENGEFKTFAHTGEQQLPSFLRNKGPTLKAGDIYRDVDGKNFVIVIVDAHNTVVFKYMSIETLPAIPSVKTEEFLEMYSPVGINVDSLPTILNITTESMLAAMRFAAKKTPDTGDNFDERMAYNVLAELGLNFNQTTQCH